MFDHRAASARRVVAADGLEDCAMLGDIPSSYSHNLSHEAFAVRSDLSQQVPEAFRQHAIARGPGDGEVEVHVGPEVGGALGDPLLDLQGGPLDRDDLRGCSTLGCKLGSLSFQALADLQQVQDCPLLQVGDGLVPRMAAKMPRGRPRTRAKRTAAVASSMVAGRNWARSFLTARRVLMEVPSSPRARLPRKVRYCW
jgi:hypothetical protein